MRFPRPHSRQRTNRCYPHSIDFCCLLREQPFVVRMPLKSPAKQCPSDPPFSQAELAQCEQQVAGCGPQIDTRSSAIPPTSRRSATPLGILRRPPVSESCWSESLAVKKCEVSLISNLTGMVASRLAARETRFAPDLEVPTSRGPVVAKVSGPRGGRISVLVWELLTSSSKTSPPGTPRPPLNFV